MAPSALVSLGLSLFFALVHTAPTTITNHTTTTTTNPTNTTNITNTTITPSLHRNNNTVDHTKLPLALESTSTNKCLVDSGTAWPYMGACNDPKVLQLYAVGQNLRTKNGLCLVADTIITGPNSSVTRPYFVDCRWDQVAPPTQKEFFLPLPANQLRLVHKDMCLEVIDPAPKRKFDADTQFVPCANTKLRAGLGHGRLQSWHLSPVARNGKDVCRPPGSVGSIDRRIENNKGRGNLTKLVFSWASTGLPQDVHENDQFTVEICLDSFPVNQTMVRQCVTRRNWNGTSFEVNVPTATENCRRHFTVVYSTICGKGKVSATPIGCVYRYCPGGCEIQGSMPAVGFPLH